MPHDPARVAEVGAWLVRAAEDLRAAVHVLTANPPILGDLVFHCQQATEKLFKAFLVWHDVVFRKTHNLEELGEQCLAVDPSTSLEMLGNNNVTRTALSVANGKTRSR